MTVTAIDKLHSCWFRDPNRVESIDPYVAARIAGLFPENVPVTEDKVKVN